MKNRQDAASGTGSSRNDRTSVSSITEINTNNSRRGSKPRRFNNNNNNKHTVAGNIDFTGDSTEMNGHAFQVNGEQRKRKKLQNTLVMLKVYASKCTKKDINTFNPLFTELLEPMIKIPAEPKGKKVEDQIVVDNKTVITSKTIISRFDEKKYDVELTTYFKNRSSLENSLQSLYIIAWRQCSKLMKNRLEAAQGLKIIKESGNKANLLTEIRRVSNEVEVSSNVYDALDEIKRRYCNCYQGDDDSNMNHIQALNDLVASIEHHGGNI